MVEYHIFAKKRKHTNMITNNKIIALVASMMWLNLSLAQMAEDFTVTDTEGQTHQLYADHLNQGQTVVVKLFFVNCPPCNAIAPDVQELYEQWGEGEADVEFFEITTSNGDDNADVSGYKSMHGLTFPAVSSEGGASAATAPFRSGTYGTYWGTPSFGVIAPDGSITYPLSFNSVNAAIAATGATGGNVQPDPTIFQISYTHPGGKNVNTQYLTATLHAAGNTSTSYNITELTNGSLSFEYPSDAIPAMSNPTLTITSNAPANTGGLSVSDIVKLRKHILDFEPFENTWQVEASDVSGEGTVSVTDVVKLQKVILGFDDAFPNNLPGQKILNNDIPLTENAGNTVHVNVQVVKLGDVN